jgi:hypothetical protein
MILFPASSRSQVTARRRKERSASTGLGDRHHPEKVIVFAGIRRGRDPVSDVVWGIKLMGVFKTWITKQIVGGNG